jgi:drug/metabolite transporter (DMT)-like permease
MLLTDSLHYVFAQLLLPHVAPGTSALVVLAVATVELGIYGMVTRRLHWRPFWDRRWAFLAIGFLVAAATNLSFHAVKYIDPGTASLLSQTSTLFALAFSFVWLRERLSPMQVVGAVLAMVGALIVTFERGNYLRLGALIVIGSAFMYALHAAFTKRYRKDMELADFFFFRLLCSTVFLLILAGATGDLEWPVARAWPLLILTGTVDVLVSRTLYYIALQRLKMSVHAIVLTVSPLAAVLWALLLFDSLPTLRQLMGGIAVVAGTLIVVSQSVRPSRSSVDVK